MSAPAAGAWRVKVGAEETSAVFEPASASSSGALFAFAHGAGGHMADRGVLALSEHLRRRGLHVVPSTARRDPAVRTPCPA